MYKGVNCTEPYTSASAPCYHAFGVSHGATTFCLPGTKYNDTQHSNKKT